MGSMPISNDISQSVVLLDCIDAACTGGYNSEKLAAGKTTDWQYEMCSGFSVRVSDPEGLLRGCLVMPIGEPPDIKRLAVSSATPCSTRTGVHVKIENPF